MRIRSFVVLAGLLLPAAAPALRAQAAPPPTVTVLFPDRAVASGTAWGVNSAGQATGVVYPAGRTDRAEAFLTGPNGQPVRGLGGLPGVPGSVSGANDVTDAGRVTGGAINAAGQPEAFLTGPDGQSMRGLGILPGYTSSSGRAVNAAGQVAGTVTAPFDRVRFETPSEAFLTGPDGQGMRGLGFLAGGSSSEAYAVNAAGQVAGVARNAANRPEAFVTGPNGEGMRGLGVLPGYDYGAAYAINSAGQVAGVMTNPGSILGVDEVFVTGPGGVGMVGIGWGPRLDRFRAFEAFVEGIDESGRVVGTLISQGGHFGFVYTPGVGLQYLDDLVGGGWRFWFGQGISLTGGYVVAIAENPELYGPNARHQVLIHLGDAATVVPEPATWALLGTGLLAVGGVTWRRRRATA